MRTTTLYGIPNCDTVKRARAWLTEQGVTHSFHDFKKQGLPEDALQRWLAEAGWETLLNRKGSTWRQLPPTEQAAVVDAVSAAVLMRRAPSVIKRPVVAWADGGLTVGFDASAWAARPR